VQIGLYGKLPTHGDFLRRRTPDGFVESWDPWLQESIAASRAILADRWLDTYLTSPVWRFAFSADVCGPQPVGGVVAPSVDRVGRYFPLTLVWQAPAQLTCLELALRYRRWFEQAERLLVDTLALEHIDFATFDDDVIQLQAHLQLASPPMRWTEADMAALLSGRQDNWRLPLPAASQWDEALGQLLGLQLSRAFNPMALWWSEGSMAVDPGGLMTRGLPAPQRFAAMLDGSWVQSEWAQVTTLPGNDAASGGSAATETYAAAPLSGEWRYSGAGLTDVGDVRSTNQDAYLERPEIGLWAVADGMGGLSHGELASRMVCDALTQLQGSTSLDDLLESAMRSLEDVNSYLRRAALRPVNAVQSGSTVVALLIAGKHCAVLWAGDSRAYRWRDGLLAQLSRDHSWADSLSRVTADTDSTAVRSPSQPVDTHAITRAVGGEDALELEVLRTDVRAGDRFLLCSDGLHRVLDQAEIARCLTHVDPAESCAALLARTRQLGAEDNVTAVVIDCKAAEGGSVDADSSDSRL
jgi:type VI secretion system protein ImpM